jgi:hypothetical protein
MQLHCERWLCCARNKLWWMTPEWGKTARELPPEAQVPLCRYVACSVTLT